MIIDAHHHLWDPGQRTYAWMTDAIAPIRRAFGIDDLEATLPREVVKTVLVQASPSLEESTALLALAATTPRIAGVVGWIDLTHDAATQIAHLRSAPGGEKLVGIRHQAQDEQDARWLTRRDVLRSLHAVAEAGLVYDLLLRTRELSAAYETVQSIPHLVFVLDHGAKPEITHGIFEPWRTELARLASLPNVTCKLSGLVTEAPWGSWTVEQLLPYAQDVLTTFGPERVLFGSDWPVCLLAASYQRVLEFAQTACAGLSQSQRDAVFATNAERIYRLERATTTTLGIQMGPSEAH